VDIAVDIVKLNPPIWRQGISLMEFFGQCAAMVRRLRTQSKREQSADSPKYGSQPGGGLAMAIHDFLLN
jgi:hypothetical protein